MIQPGKEVEQNSEEKILRDYLAIDRTRMANDRTLLAFVRTSLYMLATAVAFYELESLEKFWYLSWGFGVSSGAFLLAGIINYLRVKKKIGRYYHHS